MDKVGLKRDKRQKKNESNQKVCHLNGEIIPGKISH